MGKGTERGREKFLQKPAFPEDRDEVHVNGRIRADRQKSLDEAARIVTAALHADDAPDRIMGLLVVIVRQKRDGTYEPATRIASCWGRQSLDAMSYVAAETCVHLAQRIDGVAKTLPKPVVQ